MQIEWIKAKNFRTITTEQTINIKNGLTLVGPNNSGKTNALMAIFQFFTGYDNQHHYNPNKDLPFDDHSIKTSLTGHFSGDRNGKDKDIFEKLDKLRSLLGLPDEKPSEFSVNVYFNRDNPVYQVYPGTKRPDGKSPQCSMAQKALIQATLDCFQCHYIPSKKSIAELYEEFVLPFIRVEVAKTLNPHLDAIKDSVKSVADSMNSVLSNNGLKEVNVEFNYPDGELTKLISGFDLNVGDPDKSSIYSKGMGVQATVLLSSFKWITEQRNDRHIIWLIEEPETYMHPSLAGKASRILDELNSISTLVKTTHAINFIPPDIKKAQGVDRGRNNKTIIKSFSSHREATATIRESLGVKFSDYFALSEFNLFVEGETDKTYLEFAWNLLTSEEKSNFPYLNPEELLIKDFTGTSDLKGFLKSNYTILNQEVFVVSLFDGDKAGIDAIRELSSYFSNKDCQFNPNKEYILMPNNLPIEGLFPPAWIMDAYNTEKAWFDNKHPIIDGDGKLISFHVRDISKKAFQKYMLDRLVVDEDDIGVLGFMKIFELINTALFKQVASVDKP